jgi:3-hydroxy-9,10-secoandrosta-1,3,5(10)-triene-9,17-dione monooxygenase reductase component
MSRGPFDGSSASSALRSALGRFATGVTIVTCTDATGAPVGLTVNSFSALSLEPPLVSWALRAESPSLDAFESAGHFTVNVLSESQLELSKLFAAHAPNKFVAGRWGVGRRGAPVLAGALAVFECTTAATLRQGDHVLFVGSVLHSTAHGGAPLVFQAGRYRRLGETL